MPRTPAKPRISTQDTLRITNLTDTDAWLNATHPVSDKHGELVETGHEPMPIVLRWDGVTKVVHPGRSEFVSFDMVRTSFGDPRSIPGSRKRYKDGRDEGMVPSREDEIRRLSILYGLYEQEQEQLPRAVPLVRVETADGIPIQLPAFDPRGDAAEFEEDIHDVHDVSAIIARHQKVIEAQEAKIKELMSFRDELASSFDGQNPEDDTEIDGDDDGGYAGIG